MDIFFLILIFLACVRGQHFAFASTVAFAFAPSETASATILNRNSSCPNIAPIRGVYEGWVASSSATSFTS